MTSIAALRPSSFRPARPLPSAAVAAPPETQGVSRSNQQLQVSMILESPVAMPGPSSSFHAMTPAEHARYDATPAQFQQVRDFAQKNGLSIASVDVDTRTVKLQGKLSDYEKAFGIKLKDYRNPQDGSTYRAYQGNLHMPPALANQVEGVFGLSNHPLLRPGCQLAPQGLSGGGYAPTDVGSMYNFPKGLDGSGQTIGILEFGGGYRASDLQEYFHKLGIKQPNVSFVSIDGSTNAPGVDSGVDTEVALDIEVAGAIAPGAKIVVYYAPDTEQGFIDAINTAAHDTKNNPKTLSVSWGSPEDSKNDPPPTGWSGSGRTAVNDALKDAANLGVNVFVASGDWGSDGDPHTSDGNPHADYLATSPWAIGVGGTTLQGDDSGHIGSEEAWGDGSSDSGSGGGVSNFFPKPDYQKNVNVPAPALPAGGRGEPDVAANASPDTGYDVLVNGYETSVGGTSAAAPLYAGLTALLGQGVGQPLGFLNPFFYQNPTAFNDITSGSNGAYSAGAGWDPVTGLGSPDGDKLLAALKAQAPKTS